MKNIRIGTVFSGIGAAEYALKRLGIEHEIVFACDNGNIDLELDYSIYKDEVMKLSSAVEKKKFVDELYSKSRRTNFVKKSYLANYEMNEDYYFQDVCLLDGHDFEGKVDLFVGGSPCQSFSSVGGQLGLEDTRGTLFYEFARLVSEIKPRYFIYENVYNLLKHDKGRTWEVIQKVFDQLGYKWKLEVLNSQDYGVPQNRKRIFVVGFLNVEDFEKYSSPIPKELKYKAQDFLLEYAHFGNVKSIGGTMTITRSKEKQEVDTVLSEKLYKYVMSSGTKTFFTKPVINLEIARTILSTMGNHHRAGVDNYYSVDDNKIRRLHQREALRLMGFDDDFIIDVSRAQMYKQAGNSIVVDVLMEIFKNMFN